MALTATIYNLDTALADIDRGVYAQLDLRVAQQPSETAEFMLTRVLAYCLEYTHGIAFTEGVASGDEPAVLIRDLTGRITAWIEVGMPAADRLHRGSKLAGRAAVYTHRNIEKVIAALDAKGIHRASEIPVHAFDPEFIDIAAAALARRVELAVSVTERQLYLDINGRTFHADIITHRLR